MRIQPALILASALILPWAAKAQMTERMPQAPMSQAPMSQAPMSQQGTHGSAPGSAMPGGEQARMDTAAVENFLREAREALSAGRTHEARVSLEQAETRLLTRSVMPSQAGTPLDRGPVATISSARQALDRRDRAAVNRHIDQAMAELRQPASQPMMGGDTATGAGAPMPQAGGGGVGADGAPRNLGPAPAPMFQPGPMPGPGSM
ncbi:hypothetical protein [Falsiroseomonas sp.]|uniref:hypothetical protein n=1 Tax=Falsiroseomonas sp. TaxID=2870721 RepID=UPI002726AD1F|nr:hypothetical protein [Falsiroseomonas sp.]MDO9503171.1 hypothetical protein [Falsiroseomonas sp.]